MLGKALLIVLLLTLDASAAAGPVWPLRSGPVTVSREGQVTVSQLPAGRMSLPEGALRLTHASHHIAGHTVLHLKVTGAPGRAGEMVLLPPPRPRVIFEGLTGLQGVDGEWQLELSVTASGILLYQRRPGIERCDGATAYLFPRKYDFSTESFRPVAHLPRSEGLPVLEAKRSLDGMPTSPPLNTFHLVAASTHFGDRGHAANLLPPLEAEDGKPATAWSEALGGAGVGEFLTARSEPSPYRLKALSVLPGDTGSSAALRQSNRLKSALLLLSPTERYRVRFAEDPLATPGKLDSPVWVVLPKPVATTCATLVIEEVYPGELAARETNGGRTAIAELRFYTELEFAGGLEQVRRDLEAPDETRGAHAISVLSRLGTQGMLFAANLLRAQPTPRVAARLVKILARSPTPEALAPLAAVLPQLTPALQSTALEALVRGGPAITPLLVPHLKARDSLLVASIAHALGSIGGPAARQALLDRIGLGPDPQRAALVAGLSQLREAEDLEQVTRAAEQARDPRRQADLVLALSRMTPARAAGAATARRLAALWATVPAFEARYRLIGALGRLDGEGQLALLREAARLSDPVLRGLAAEQLRRVSTQQATSLLRQLLEDTDPHVRTVAALGLAHRPSEQAISTSLAHRLDEERWPMVARTLAEALGRHCSPAGLAALRRVTRSGPRGVDERALISLASCHPPGIAEELLTIARSSRWRATLRQRALETLTPEMARALTPQLVQLFSEARREAPRSDDDEALAVAATHALAASQQSAAAEALADALALDPHESIRTAAALALGQLCQRQTAATLRRAAAQDSSSLVQRAARQSLKRCRW